MPLTRRHLVISTAATAACAAMPAASAIAAAETAPAVTYMDPALVAWTPGRFYRSRQLISVAGRWRCVMMLHIASDEPSDRYLSRPLRINEDGVFEEESA